MSITSITSLYPGSHAAGWHVQNDGLSQKHAATPRTMAGVWNKAIEAGLCIFISRAGPSRPLRT